MEPYWSAGYKYNWLAEHHRFAIGLNKDYFINPGWIEGGRLYVKTHWDGKRLPEKVKFVDAREALECIKKYKAIKRQRSVILGCVPFDLFHEYENHN